MPFKDCVRSGKIYCYDKERKKVFCFVEQVYDLHECPDNIIAALIDKKKGETVTVEETAAILNTPDAE